MAAAAATNDRPVEAFIALGLALRLAPPGAAKKCIVLAGYGSIEGRLQGGKASNR